MSHIGVTIVLILIVTVGIIYNRLTKARNKVREAYASIATSLQKRWDLVPGFVEIVKGYSTFEEATIAKLTSLRNQKFEDFKMEQKLDVDKNMAKIINKMITISENDPELTANEEYTKLTEQFEKIEKNISKSKKEYNKAVKEYNTKLEVVPNNVVAILFGFNEEKKF
ncbi:MAG: LemA family protein [Clostridia bacterium]|nr:LemA family protein [Clostridia bacterium]